MAEIKLQPGDVVRWESENHMSSFIAIVGSHKLPPDSLSESDVVVPAEAWNEGQCWVTHSIGRMHLGWGITTLITGDEADRIHASYAAAKLRGEVEYR